jgi:hypothetical protein
MSNPDKSAGPIVRRWRGWALRGGALHGRPRYGRLLGGWAVACLLVGCVSDPVACLHDGECSEGRYCKATRCVEPSAEGPLLDVYRTRVAPLIETGCNCHGPQFDRPWRFDHRQMDDAGLAATLAELRNWMYNPHREYTQRFGDGGVADDRAEAIDRYALLGYAIAECGFNHPLIWEADDPQVRELALWFARAYDEIARPPPTAERPTAEPTAPLPAREQAVFAAATAPSTGGSVFAGFDPRQSDLEARVVRQCECCHVPPRSFKLDAIDAIDATALANAARLRSDANLCAATSQLPLGLIYSLGLGQHPVVYLGADDPRHALLHRWFSAVKAITPAITCEPPCKEPEPELDAGPDPPDGGADMGIVHPAFTAYLESIGPILHATCGRDSGCHARDDGSFPHRWPVDDNEALDQLRRLDDLDFFDRARPANSRLIFVGRSVDNHSFPGLIPFSPAEIEQLTGWIGDLPQL